jgi:hypothetical protein
MFSPSAIRSRSPYCKYCRNAQHFEHRHQSSDNEAAVALYNMEHTRYGRQGMIPRELVTAILDAAERKSALSGATERLRIRRFWEDLPLCAENAVVVTADENRVLGRKKMDARLTMFPAALVARLMAWRDAQLAASESV